MTKQKSSAMILPDMLEARKALRKNVLQIDNLENLTDLKNLKLKLVDVKEEIVMIFYECIASRELYPNIGEKLIEKEVIRKDNLINFWLDNKGEYNEYEEVCMRLDFPKYKVRVFLKAYNPDYKISPNSKILKTNLLIH